MTRLYQCSGIACSSIFLRLFYLLHGSFVASCTSSNFSVVSSCFASVCFTRSLTAVNFWSILSLNSVSPVCILLFTEQRHLSQNHMAPSICCNSSICSLLTFAQWPYVHFSHAWQKIDGSVSIRFVQLRHFLVLFFLLCSPISPGTTWVPRWC